MIAALLLAVTTTDPAWSDSVRIPPGHHIEIDARVTRLKVVGGADTTVRVTGEEGAPRAVVIYQDGILFVRGADPRGPALAGTYRIQVPSSAAVRVRDVLTSVEVHDVATAKVTVSDAAVTVSDVSGSVSVVSILGSISIARVGGDAQASSGAGDVTVHAVRGQASVRSVTGRVDVGEIADQGSIETTSGDIHFRGDPTPNVQYSLDTHSGTITIELGASASVTVHTTARAGNVESTVQGARTSGSKIIVGKGEADMSARSFSGVVRIVQLSPKSE